MLERLADETLAALAGSERATPVSLAGQAAAIWLAAKQRPERTAQVLAGVVRDLGAHTLDSGARQGGTDTRARWLLDLFAGGALEVRILPRVSLQRWGQGVDEALLWRLFEVLAADDLAGQNGALSYGAYLAELGRRELSEQDVHRLAELLQRTARLGLASSGSVSWQRLAKTLIRAGHVGPVVAAVVASLECEQSHGLPRHIRETIGVLLEQGHGPALWEPVAARLLHRRGLRLKLECLPLLAHVPAEIVLVWIGQDEARAAAVAGLCMPWSEPLDPISRAVLTRFGLDSEAGRALTRRALAGLRGRPWGDTDFLREQLARARQWQADAAPEVARWAGDLGDAIERDLAVRATGQVRTRSVHEVVGHRAPLPG